MQAAGAESGRQQQPSPAPPHSRASFLGEAGQRDLAVASDKRGYVYPAEGSAKSPAGADATASIQYKATSRRRRALARSKARAMPSIMIGAMVSLAPCVVTVR